MPSPIYFDLTDLIRFAESNDHVTGIQRVELRVFLELLKTHGPNQIKAIALTRRQQWVELPTTELLTLDDFDATTLLIKTGFIRKSRGPQVAEVKRYLRPYQHNKLLRGLIKLGVHLQFHLAPHQLEKKGFKLFRNVPALRVLPKVIENLPTPSVLVRITPNVTDSHIQEFCKRQSLRGVRVCQMIHDLIPITHPHFHVAAASQKFSTWLLNSTTYVSTYLCVSQNTHQDLLDFFRREQITKDIKTTPLAHEFFAHPRNARCQRPATLAPFMSALANQNYVLCVGSIEIRKNGLGLLNAWDQVAKARPDDKTKLVFAGRIGWLVDDFLARLASSPSLRERVILLTSPSDADLAWLYGHCLFTIYPSRYEGWGLPVGESLWFGKPCLASRASSIPEVGDDLIDYFDPESITDMAECITKVLSHPEALQAQEQRIRQAALRSWADLSEAVYSAVIESTPT